MTPILKVLTEYCATYVDDIRLQEKAVKNPPLYAREMSQYLRPAIALFNLPAEMPEYLLGTVQNPKFVDPQYNSYRYTTPNELTESTAITLGDDYKNFELFNAQILTFTASGKVIEQPTNLCTYNAENGIIVIYATAENPIPANTTFDFDFYTDGSFVNDLSPQIMNILGLCFKVVWIDRFNNDWLSNVAKVEDKSFFEQNRANKMRADTERLNQAREILAGEMRKFEQNAFYKRQFPSGNRLNF